MNKILIIRCNRNIDVIGNSWFSTLSIGENRSYHIFIYVWANITIFYSVISLGKTISTLFHLGSYKTMYAPQLPNYYSKLLPDEKKEIAEIIVKEFYKESKLVKNTNNWINKCMKNTN